MISFTNVNKFQLYILISWFKYGMFIWLIMGQVWIYVTKFHKITKIRNILVLFHKLLTNFQNLFNIRNIATFFPGWYFFLYHVYIPHKHNMPLVYSTTMTHFKPQLPNPFFTIIKHICPLLTIIKLKIPNSRTLVLHNVCLIF